MSQVEPLVGYTVAITAERRRDELATLLIRRGAAVVEAPCLRILPVEDDGRLRADTIECLRLPVDYLVATTAVGIRGWFSASASWGIGDELHAHLAAATIIARGPKVKGAIRAAGLAERWSPESESNAEVLDYLRTIDLVGKRVVVQLHASEPRELVAELAALGAEVLAIQVYRCEPPADLEPVLRLVSQIVDRKVDAVTFTSVAAVEQLIAIAGRSGDELLEALRGDVIAACVGPVTAAPLLARGVPAVSPERFRLGALVRTVVDALTARTRVIEAAGHRLEVRARAVVTDNEVIALPRASAALLHALMEQPGHVLSRAQLLERLGGDADADEHAVEVAVARLRSALGPASPAVATVVKRGYRLAVG
ncbi:MAG TPA: uroporphyrinogen-III synthase [Mycobacteriales bacterium]|nr:uroporphyrinogen-III synthase [Mycobacteriales bacterium]